MHIVKSSKKTEADAIVTEIVSHLEDEIGQLDAACISKTVSLPHVAGAFNLKLQTNRWPLKGRRHG